MTDSIFMHVHTTLHQNLKTDPSPYTLIHENLKRVPPACTMMKLIFVLLLLIPSVAGQGHSFFAPPAQSLKSVEVLHVKRRSRHRLSLEAITSTNASNVRKPSPAVDLSEVVIGLRGGEAMSYAPQGTLLGIHLNVMIAV